MNTVELVDDRIVGYRAISSIHHNSSKANCYFATPYMLYARNGS